MGSNDSDSHNQVIVLQAGYSCRDEEDETAMRANCSCTLVRCRDGTNILVDTMTAWDGEHLRSLLAKHGVGVDEVHVVVCSHGHSDHIGCNYLFQEARMHLVGACVSHRDLYMGHFGGGQNDEELALDSNAEVVVRRSPGHTLSCVSVIVNNTQLGGRVGITGDLFERLEDIEDDSIWRDAGSENEELQRQERSKMADICNFIVPGHGTIFSITPSMRIKLRKDMTSNC
ncbi:LOW QUALITY PROTEIN: metallo-beta-lactamase domain-containing protein 1 [Drosophila ficusphila]|uniref:LOW QUALITY PROTEIN: metallo-beta-lactamase domain-containing protein 1 n=1 Tax=Drosophila ficusphila TaxID=30025 RepID=UPI0007E89A6E|nr:LOW QUALITY PROTEIN: metallo-beta-lactamase domain-containing protein 1 [Drosophila ficusphila]